MPASFSAKDDIGPMRTSPGQAHAMGVTEETTRTAPATTQSVPSSRPEPQRTRLPLKGSLPIAAETRRRAAAEARAAAAAREAAEARAAAETDTEQEAAWESEGGTSPAARDSRTEPMAVRPDDAAARR
jgi:hypothetical protein